MNDQPSLSPFWREDLAYKILLIIALGFWGSIIYHILLQAKSLYPVLPFYHTLLSPKQIALPYAIPIFRAGWLTVTLLSALVWLHKPWTCKIICTLFLAFVFHAIYPGLLKQGVNHTAIKVLLIISLVLLCLGILDTAWKCYFSLVEERGKLRPNGFWLRFGGFLLPLMAITLYDLLIGGVIGLALTILIQGVQTYFDHRFPVISGVAGRILSTHGAAQRYFDKVLPPNDPGINFSGLRIPTTWAVQNFLICGAIGSGKTNELRLLLQDILPQIHDSGE